MTQERKKEQKEVINLFDLFFTRAFMHITTPSFTLNQFILQA